MAFSEETYIKILQYLDNELSAEERASFEQEINADKELAQEVALQQEMGEMLADSPENNLRQSLQTINGEINDIGDLRKLDGSDGPDNSGDSSGGSGGFGKYFLWGIPVLLIAGAAWWFLQPANTSDGIESLKIEKEEPEVTTSTSEPPTDNTSLTEDDPGAEDITDNTAIEENEPAAKDSTVSNNSSGEEPAAETEGLGNNSITRSGGGANSGNVPEIKIDSLKEDLGFPIPTIDTLASIPPIGIDSEPLADPGNSTTINLDPIPELDQLIGAKTDNDLFILTGKATQRYGNKGGGEVPVDFRLSGTIKLNTSLVDPADTSFVAQLDTILISQGFQFYLYSNNLEDYKAAKSLSSEELSPNRVSEYGYDFNVNTNINLKPGLYYYLIKNMAEDKIPFVGMFIVSE